MSTERYEASYGCELPTVPVCWVTCDVGAPEETARITPRVSANAIGISSGAAARAVRRRLARRFALLARLPKPPSINVTLAPSFVNLVGASVTPLLNSYRVDSESYPCDYCLSARFPERGDALADADAHGGGALGDSAAAHLVQQRGDDPRARAAERVADGDRAAVHVDLLRVELELVDAGDRLGGERLVQLDQFQVFDAPAGPGEDAVHRGNRADAHVVGVHAGSGGADVARERRHARAVHGFLRHEQQRGGTVVER